VGGRLASGSQREADRRGEASTADRA